MKVWLQSEAAQRRASQTVYACPASEMRKADCPSDWLDESGRPLTIEVDFKFGCAEVPSNLGEYLVSRGLAGKSRLIIPNGVKVA